MNINSLRFPNLIKGKKFNHHDFSSESFMVAPGDSGKYPTIQSALDAAHSVGGGTVYLQTGVYEENLQFYANTGITGLASSDNPLVELIGVHTPPETGDMGIWNIKMTSSSDIFSSSISGTGQIVLAHNNYTVNGYIFNLPKWEGSLITFALADQGSVNSGVVYNLSGAEVWLLECTLGVGSEVPCVLTGNTVIETCNIICPLKFSNDSSVRIYDSNFFETTSFEGFSGGFFVNSYIQTDNSPAILYESENELIVSGITINSNFNPAISGSGVGYMQIGSISFIGEASFSNRLNTSFHPFVSGELISKGLGNGLSIEEGHNARMGVAALKNGIAEVKNSIVSENSRIFLTPQAGEGVSGYLSIVNRENGTGFTISSSSSKDNSLVAWVIFEPA